MLQLFLQIQIVMVVTFELKFYLNKDISSINHQLKIGIIHYTKIVVSESPQMLKGRIQLFQE